MRRFGTPSPRADATLKWLSEGRNRKSVTIDLRQPEGVQLFLALAASRTCWSRTSARAPWRSGGWAGSRCTPPIRRW
jgi:hypothetical protein